MLTGDDITARPSVDSTGSAPAALATGGAVAPVPHGGGRTVVYEAVPAARPGGRGTAARLASIAVPPVVVFCLFIGLWYAVSYLALNADRRFLLPPPHDVVRIGFLDWHNLHEILRGLLSTTRVALSGYAIAVGTGTSFAVIMSQAKWLERSFYPYAVALQTLPVLAMVPLVGLWMGFDFRSRVLICSVLALFPIITNTLFGLLSVDPPHHDLFTLMGTSRLERLWRLQLPAALPAVFTGLRISAGLSVIGAIVADFFFRQGDKGIGRLLDVYRNDLQTERLYAAIVCSALLGLTIFMIITTLARVVLRNWHASAGSGR